MKPWNLISDAYRELCKMPVGEGGFRIWHRLKEAGGRVNASAVAPGTGASALDAESPLRFFINPARKAPASEFLARHYDLKQLVQEADKICKHRFRLFHNQLQSFDESIDWHFATGKATRYPKVYFDGVPISDVENFGDVKWTWELNRHQHFYVLGRAYWATGDEKYAREFAGQLQSWVEQNPYLVGVNWTSALEVAIRGIAWLWAYHFFLPSPHFETVREKLLDVLLLHARYLDRYMTMNYSPSNHVIAEAAGLLQLGLFFPRHPAARSWVEKTIHLLEREIGRQVFASGESKEQSPSYHRFVLDFFTLSYLVARMNGKSFSRAFASRLEKMFEYMRAVLKPDGRAYSFGDCDDARVFRLSCRPVDDCRGVLSTGAVIFHNPMLKAAVRGFDEESFWLLGESACKVFSNVSVKPVQTESLAYPDSGFFLLRSKDSPLQLRFDCGRHGLPRNFSHGHADALSIEVAVEGKEALMDGGTYGYNVSPLWRNFFRSSFAHNTVIVDGKPQALPRLTFRWQEVPRVECVGWGFGQRYDYVEGLHDGYRKLPDPVSHRRIVLFVKPDCFYIIDVLEASLEHEYEQLLHFAPGKIVVDASGKVRWQGENRAALLVEPIALHRVRTSVIEGTTDPPQGWVSRGYGEKEPAPVVSLKTRGIGRTVLGFRISAVEATAKDAPKSSVQKHGHLLIYGEESGPGEELLMLSPGSLSWQFDEIGSDAELVFLKRETTGKVESGLIVGGSFFKFGRAHLEFAQPGKLLELETFAGKLQARQIGNRGDRTLAAHQDRLD